MPCESGAISWVMWLDADWHLWVSVRCHPQALVGWDGRLDIPEQLSAEQVVQQVVGVET